MALGAWAGPGPHCFALSRCVGGALPFIHWGDAPRLGKGAVPGALPHTPGGRCPSTPPETPSLGSAKGLCLACRLGRSLDGNALQGNAFAHNGTQRPLWNPIVWLFPGACAGPCPPPVPPYPGVQAGGLCSAPGAGRCAWGSAPARLAGKAAAPVLPFGLWGPAPGAGRWGVPARPAPAVPHKVGKRRGGPSAAQAASCKALGLCPTPP